jgi:hypothetical protein
MQLREYATDEIKVGQGKVVHFCNPSYLEGRMGESRSEASLGKSTRPYLKNKLKAGLGDIVQVVEHLPTTGFNP